MPRGLSNLPTEVVEGIAGQMGLCDLANLSTTNVRLHSIIAPMLFKTVSWTTLTNEPSGLIQAATLTNGDFIKDLVFHFIYLDTMFAYTGSSGAQRALAQSTNLAGKVMELNLPRLNNLKIQFDLKIFERSLKHKFLKTEHMYTNYTLWLASLDRFWVELFKNEGLQSLTLESMPPAAIPADPAADDFFGRLQTLDISIFGALVPTKDGAWIEGIANRPDYVAAIQSLELNIFDRLIDLTNLSFCASQHAPIGAGFDIPLPMGQNSMPNLKTLRLQNMIISRDLANFITAHEHTLTDITLDDCHARCPHPSWLHNYDNFDHELRGEEYETMVWAEFFHLIGEDGTVLTSILVKPDTVPFRGEDDDRGVVATTTGAGKTPFDTSYTVSESSAELREAVKGLQIVQPSRRPFSYIDFETPDSAFWFTERDANCRHFLLGHDDRAFKDLLTRLTTNKTRMDRERLFGPENY